MEIFNDLLALSQSVQGLSHLEGRFPGLRVGICTDRDDPMQLGRIKCAIAHMGGKSESDWLMRVGVMPMLSLPVPRLGDTVVLLFKDGDPHQGFYLGVVQNLLNPAGDVDSVTTAIPKDLTVNVGESIVFQCGEVSLSISDGVIDIQGASDVKINGKSVVVLGGKDSRNDTLVQKGY